MRAESSLLAELKRRNVIRMAGLYLVASWLIVQVTATILPMFGAPEWLPRSVVVLLAVAFIPALLFSWIYEITPEGIKRESEIDPQESITPRTGARMDRAIVALLMLAVGIFAVDRFVLAPKRAATTTASAQKEEVHSAPEASIAVLPLANAGDKDEQFFSDGLSESLIVALSRFDGIAVIGRNSSFQFRDSKEDSRSIGQKLGVAHLLEGSVQRAGDVVRITAALTSTSSGRTVWSERYDRPYHDLFALQDEITAAVAGALKAKLLASAAAPVPTDRPPSGNLEAYTAYLQGKYYSDRNNETDFPASIREYEAATHLDPRYALAWADLSRQWTSYAGQHLTGDAARDAYAKARETGATALRIDPNLADAHGARALLLSYHDFDWLGAEAEYRRALELSPNDGQTKVDLGRMVGTLGRPDESVALIKAALEVDPLNARWRSWLGTFQTATGNLDEAHRSAVKAIELQPIAVAFHYRLAITEVLAGNYDAALSAAENEPPGPWHDFAVAVARQPAADRAAADAALKHAIDRHTEFGPFQIAGIHAARNDPDKMFEWLERALAARDPGMQGLLFDALLLGYKDDPRFGEIARKAGLPATSTGKAQRIPVPKAGKA
jgi:TolB-like protein